MRSIRSNDPCWCGSGEKYKRCHKASPVAPGRVSSWRSVPPGIDRPDYADSGHPRREREPAVKSADVIDRMRRTCRLAADVLAVGGAAVQPEVTTDEIDAIVHQAYIDRGAYPSTLNYHGYPKSLCTSVNEVICHGIPDDRPLEEGDIVNLDVTAYKEGVHGDTNATFTVGSVDAVSSRLIRVTRECLERGIEAVRPGRPINVIGRAIEDHAAAADFGVVRAFVGHSIGEVFHGGLGIPHYFDSGARTVIEPGMVFTIEPMITIGSWRHTSWADGWTAVTEDLSRTAQFEHTILVTDRGAEVLTRR